MAKGFPLLWVHTWREGRGGGLADVPVHSTKELGMKEMLILAQA